MPVVYLGVGWLIGVAAAAISLPFSALMWAGGAGIALAVALRPTARPAFLVLLSVVLAALGYWHYQQALPDALPLLARYVQNDAPHIQLQALVVDEPDQRAVTQRVRLGVRAVYDNGRWRQVDGDVLAYVSSGARYRYGDLLEVRGRLEAPPVIEEFDYREYLMRQGIVGIVYRPQVERLARGQGNPVREVIFGLRERLSDTLAAALPEPQAALAQAILIGHRTAIPQGLTDDLNATGTSHLIAISGQNVVIIAALLMAGLVGFVGHRPAAAATIAAIVAYAVLTGAPPSVQRATIMGSLLVLAAALGRQSSAAVSLVMAAAAMAAVDPQLIEDASFQLSFAATAGLALLSPSLHTLGRRLVLRRRDDDLPAGPADALIGLLAATLAAIAFTLPITAAHFQRVSLVAPLANLLVVPAFPLMMLGSAVVALVGVVSSAMAAPFAWLAWLPLCLLSQVAGALAGLPLASIEIKGFGLGHVAAYYAALALITWRLGRGPASSDEPEPSPVPQPASSSVLLSARTTVLGVAVLGLATTAVWASLLWSASAKLTVTFLDVGQGDAALIEAPNGTRLLVDGGPSGQAIANALSGNLPVWDRRIDLIVLTHPQEDHLAGLVTVLERYEIGAFLDPGISSNSETYDNLRQLMQEKGVVYQQAVAGQRLDLGKGAHLEVLHPPPGYDPDDEINNASVVLRLRFGHTSFLFTGDIEAPAEASLVASEADLKADVLKVAHHGSVTSTTEELLRAVQPSVAVISVGEDNPFGQPTVQTLERLKGRVVLRTDQRGSVTISTDGKRLWVKTEREASTRH